MLVGKLVTFTDWEATGGFTQPERYVGLVIDVPSPDCLPPVIRVLLPNEVITVYADEVDYVEVQSV